MMRLQEDLLARDVPDKEMTLQLILLGEENRKFMSQNESLLVAKRDIVDL